MPFCASCGRYCSTNEAKEDTRGVRDQMGSVSWSRIEPVSYCRDCAQSQDKTGRLVTVLLIVFVVFGASCVGVNMIRWIFP